VFWRSVVEHVARIAEGLLQGFRGFIGVESGGGPPVGDLTQGAF
jgi:hypothetical protein